jgi:hypothetical protein
MKSVQVIKVASLTTLLLVAAWGLGFSTSLTVPSAAATTSTTAPSSLAGLELSPQPIYQEVSRQIGENLINETHVEGSFAANGNLTLPNATEPIRTTSRGSILISFVDATAIGEQVITTTEGEEGGETATAKFFGIARLEQEGSGRSIVIAVVHTNSTGMLAPLNGMILAGDAEFDAEGTTTTTLWEWQGSGIPLSTNTTTGTSTATSETNVTTAAGTTDGGEE